ncbi:MFS transporter [Nocardioides sp. GY 10113]|uniref:MFS transporter n=1 Tax=Nocardioides sp. GY 10113 TaxID=2569761 RepID=UPI0010A7C28C|nr:MFS transporter [Nocardioides sp. GY 10113]TIC86324.1 MFS transporter [Nocardioides sp. GY 10113]
MHLPAALRHRDYRLLVSASATSALGNAITPIALAFAVLDLGGSATELGLVVAAFALTEVVTSLFGGVLGDRVSRKLMLEGSALGSALTQVVIAAALIGGWATIPMLGVIGALNGCLSALSNPSSRAMTRLTVPPGDLGSAVSLRALLQTSAATVGFVAGGLLVATVGPGWAIAVDAATYAVAALCFAALRVAHSVPDGERGSMLADLGDGAREVFAHRWLWLLIGQALICHLVWSGAQGVLGPIVIGDAFGREAWGLAMGTLMAGFVVGGLLCLRWRPRRLLRVGTVLLSMTALFPLAMALSDHLWPVLAGAFLHGFGLQVFDVFWDLSIQQNVDPDKLARVYSFDAAGSFVARPLGLALAGPIALAVGLHAWLAVVAAVMGATALAALFSGEVRRLERRTTLSATAPAASPSPEPAAAR